MNKAPKGTKDVLPSEIYKWQFLEKTFEKICEKYGFTEMRTPTFEHTEVFARGVGDTTDIVQKEMYTFLDYGKRSITLRPEGTSGIARAFVEQKLYADAQPTKLFYNISCFRYEKPQAGRLREFHQFGVETFGTTNMMADSEVIGLAKNFLNELGITNVELRINSIGCNNCRPNHREALKEFLSPKYDQLCDTCKERYERNPLRILDCKSPNCQSLVEGAPVMMDHLCDECKDAFEELKFNLEAMGIEYTVDEKIVRGLDYYTKTAFEFICNDIGAQGTVCGGGRYDHLIEQLDGPFVPGVGFGLGIERLILTMEANGIEIEKPQGPDCVIIVAGDTKKYALGLLSELRNQGYRVELDIMERNVKGQFKFANRVEAKYAVVIGENELETGKLTLKNMTEGTQVEVSREDLGKEIKS